MNKAELVKAVAQKAGISQAQAAKAIKAMTEAIQETLVAKSRVQLIGFGSFQTVERAARTGRNPQTGKEIKIAAATSPVFRAGKALKVAVNAKKAVAAAKNGKKKKKK